MDKIARIGLGILGASILGTMVLQVVGNGGVLISEAIGNARRKRLDKLANDPNSRIIKIGNEYYEMGDVIDCNEQETNVEGTDGK